MKEFEVLDQFIKKSNNIYIYGCGTYGRIVYSYLQENFLEVFCGFVVSQKAVADMKFCGHDVFEIDNLEVRDGDGIIVAMLQIPFEVKQNCYVRFSENILFIYSDLINTLNTWIKNYYCELYKQYESEYELSISVKAPDPSCIYIIGDGKTLFRNFDLQKEKDLLVILRHATINAFENQYGNMKFLNELSGNSENKNGVNIGVYIITSHLDSMMPGKEELYSYEMALQVGSVFTQNKKECLQDCMGDHISSKNKEYCECTGLYWIWKNDLLNDYVGLEHYRRRMNLSENLCDIIGSNDIDIILPIPQFCIFTIYNFIIRSLVTGADWGIVKKIISEIDTEYESTIDQYERGHFYFSCNIGLMKKSILDDYCNFAFDVAGRLEKYYEDHNIIRKADRYMGFIFEHLFSIYIMKNYDRYRVYCTELLWCE